MPTRTPMFSFDMFYKNNQNKTWRTQPQRTLERKRKKLKCSFVLNAFAAPGLDCPAKTRKTFERNIFLFVFYTFGDYNVY